MLKITKEFTWDMAHILENHPSKCKNLHGHTYKMLVTITRDELVDNMVVDFADVKKIVKELTDELDHAFAYNKNSDKEYVRQIAQILKDNDLKVYEFETRSTCEEMIKHFYDVLEPKFEEIGVQLVELELYEGPGSYARYSK